jgi:hypothetical protein
VGSVVGSLAGGIAGGGGGSAPKVNLSGQIGNANQTYQTATGDAAQTMNTATAYNANAQKNLNTSLGQETPEVSTINNAANSNLSTYGSTFTPLQKEQADQAANYTSDSNIQRLQGQAVADQSAAAQANLKNQRAALASEGVDPASIGGASLTQQAGVEAGANEAGAASNAYDTAQKTGAQLMQGANEVGIQAGQLGTSQAGVGANVAAGNVNETNQTNSSGINNLTAANSYLNTGTNANQSSANIANQQFNDQQTSYEDQQQQSANKGALVGNIVGGMSLGGLEKGGPVTSRGALPHPVIPGTTDSKVVALTPGEFVIPKDVTNFLGHSKLHNIIEKARNEMHQRGYAIPPQGHATQGV